jgi:hypothetical protein
MSAQKGGSPANADFVSQLLEGPREFIKESIHLVNRCTKPDRRGSLSHYGDWIVQILLQNDCWITCNIKFFLIVFFDR